MGYSRDYQLVVLPMPDPRTGTTPPPLRYLFRYCVQATCTTALPARTWRVSLDDRLTTCETRVEYDGYVWGVKWQALYPGATLISDSPTARSWAAAIGIDFHEVRFETNVHVLTLVFSDLHIEELPPPATGTRPPIPGSIGTKRTTDHLAGVSPTSRAGSVTRVLRPDKRCVVPGHA
ncbi:hypothetical protein ACFSTC_49645 [Nonomuraea ferruginea]